MCFCLLPLLSGLELDVFWNQVLHCVLGPAWATYLLLQGEESHLSLEGTGAFQKSLSACLEARRKEGPCEPFWVKLDLLQL